MKDVASDFICNEACETARMNAASLFFAVAVLVTNTTNANAPPHFMTDADMCASSAILIPEAER